MVWWGGRQPRLDLSEGGHRTRFWILVDTWYGSTIELNLFVSFPTIICIFYKTARIPFFFKILTSAQRQRAKHGGFWLKDKDGSLRHWLSSVAPTPHHKAQPTVATSHPSPFPIIKIFSHPRALFLTLENLFWFLRFFNLDWYFNCCRFETTSPSSITVLQLPCWWMRMSCNR